MQEQGFTLIEVIAVILIIGVLATLGLTHYGGFRENALDREAEANLRLIIAAERIHRMETGNYIACADTTVTNTNLNLVLTTTSWTYLTTASNAATPPVACAEATRVGGTRQWHYHNTDTGAPSSGPCS